MGKCHEMTPVDASKMKEVRDKIFGRFKIVFFIQLFLTVFSIAVGIVLVVNAAANPSFPFIAAAPIYTPLPALIGAIVGLIAIREGAGQDEVSSRVIQMITAVNSLNSTSNSLSIMSFAWGIVGIVHCTSTDLNMRLKCLPNESPLFIGSILATILGLLIAATCITCMCFFYKIRRAIGLSNKCC